ncbi:MULTISPECIES: NAD kinase [unclassified Sporosarcina]|uniref:NAD kinase n=1 Tax=unclassified Sporosarcina TaxID=2647733 RepID=UPI00203D5B5C|nr:MULTISPECIES: NAD kinase [unclassified Sporosarcina]GKV64815.1 NAD kinase 2 [Sporosarcina sp. NCCP-2331]GLB54925.1 NAD kinase 2 [Sporosarcina sp. NCCP-2378]
MATEQTIYLFSRLDEDMIHKKAYVEKQLKKEGFTLTDHHTEAAVIISIGSDGTFLQAARKTDFRRDCLYIGLSVKGEHGVYCDFKYDDISSLVRTLKQPNIEERHYPLLEVTINQHKPFFCLNEFSIRSTIIRTFVMDISIDELLFETFLGDGMIISTPTGSTAYNKSVRGAVIDPLLPCFQVSELASVNNNRYRTLGTSFILSGSRKLTLDIQQEGNEFPSTAADNEALAVKQVEKVEAVLSDRVIRTAKLSDNSFFEKVQRTFF